MNLRFEPLRLLIFLAPVVSLLLAGCSDDNSSIERTNVIVSDDVSSHRILSIVQDSCGYIWMGTYRGLNRYDGNQMHQYFCDEKPGSLPDNMITALHCDHTGRLWVGTKNGVSIYNEKDLFDTVAMPDSASTLAFCFAESSRGDMFLLQPGQVLKYDSVGNRFEKFISNIEVGMYGGNRCYADAEDNLWIVSSKGVSCYSTVTKRKLKDIGFGTSSITTSYFSDNRLWLAIRGQGLRVYDTEKNEWVEDGVITQEVNRTLSLSFITSIYTKPSLGRLFIGTNAGMFEVRLDTHRLIRQGEQDFPFEAPDFVVFSCLYDRDNNMWLGSESQGYTVRSSSNAFSNDEYLNRQIQRTPVSSVCLQDNSLLWIATMRQGIYRYDIHNHQTKHFSFDEISKFLPDTNSQPYFIMTDSKGQLWISFVPGYVLCLRPEGDKLNKVACYSVPAAIVLCEAADHTIWVGTYGNSYYTINPDDGVCTHHSFTKGNNTFIANFRVLRDKRLAVLTKGEGLWFVNPGSTELGKPVISSNEMAACITHGAFIPSSIYQDTKGNLWMGTVGNKLLRYDLSSGKLTKFSDAPCEDISSIEEDGKGNIWVSAQQGLGMLDVEKGTFSNYYKSDGLNGNEFYDRCSVRLPDGRLVFGGEHGLTVFNPQEIRYETSPRLRLEDLRINNMIVCPSDDAPIDTRLSCAEEINLNYRQNNFSISYSAQDYGSKVRYSYQYRLKGLSDTWVDAKQSHEAFFSNVKAGNYTFSVRILSQDLQQVLAECSIPVSISPAPWLSWWAKMIYLLLALGAVVYAMMLYRRIENEKHSRMLSEKDREQEKRINRMNMSFFANVSHEFRTPLTLISGPIIQLANDKALPKEAHSMLLIMHRSVERMLRLVNQMMDFHKLEDDALRLEVQNTDVVRIIADIVESFQLQAHDKHLLLTSSGLEESVVSWIDPDKIEKIIYNLLGNAIKYTPASGHIELTFDIISREETAMQFKLSPEDKAQRYIQIQVADSGPGIPESEINKVFERFYQISRQNSGAFNWGTGIGLYYCNRLVQLHHGHIKVENRTGDTTGSIFTFILPMGEEAYAHDQHLQTAATTQASLYPLIGGGAADIETDDNEAKSSKPTIVVVDDDTEIVRYLRYLLRPEYNIIDCTDADSALAAVNEKEPDLVISDVIMPGKDGYTLCREIKNSMQICHIPVILVTAKTTTSDQIEGFDSGAEAYVSKPFDPNYLLKLVASIISNRQKVRKLLSQSTQTDDIEENVLNAQDSAFMAELYAIMEKELSNPEIDINHITDIMHVSRTKFYYKIKGLTGEKPGNFFRLYKLNRAAELIRKGDNTLSEISDMTGFSSPSYFSTCFKKQFGVSPRDYA